MKIEILYFDGCPHYMPAVELVNEVLREERSTAQVVAVNVPDQTTALATGFLGSPTIRVNGLDVEPEARALRDYGITCRTYQANGRMEGLPSRELIRQAIREDGSASTGSPDCCQQNQPNATAGASPKRPSLFMAGSIIAAIGASFCCTLPIVFALTGVSVLGASAFFDSLRPYLLVATFGLLGSGFYYAYRPIQEASGAPGSSCAVPSGRRASRIVLWLAAAMVIALAAFPYYSGPVAEFLLAGGS
ncbi:MAG: mercuric transporter MerT family protein [Gemmatimonadaceae bacterium]